MVSADKEKTRGRLIEGVSFAEPEHYHCPNCNTILEPHSANCDFFFCRNCSEDFLVLEGEVLSEVA